ncbi:hypothetical protein OF83DRAFT_1173173 [Amylostereum chailletii]|nr:hypothetical protein OF83DRAFT_1173173 [Amylostereum chailletii]
MPRTPSFLYSHSRIHTSQQTHNLAPMSASKTEPICQWPGCQLRISDTEKFCRFHSAMGGGGPGRSEGQGKPATNDPKTASSGGKSAA